MRTRKINVANPNDRSMLRGRWGYGWQSYLFAFGAYGDTLVLAYGCGLDSAFDEAVDWIAENAPGLLMNDAVNEAYHEAIKSGMSENDAREEAEMDMTCGGNAGDYIASWEWAIVAENPSKANLIAIHRGR